MAVPDLRRLALVFSTVRAANGSTQYRVGTGYFITGTLVLTASHVVPENAQSVEIRTGEGSFHEAHIEPVWRDVRLDAVLIRATPGLKDIPAVQWPEQPYSEDTAWESTAYAIAAKQQVDKREQWKGAGLDGTLYGQGGGGQGVRELDLSVNAPATPEGWGGISGAPVFVDGKLAGIIKEVPSDFKGNRVRGVPADLLREDPEFLKAIATPWLQIPQGQWVLGLVSEGREGDLGNYVPAAIERFNGDNLASAAGLSLHNQPVMKKVTEALESRERWFQFLSAVCAAPVMIADVTGFEPAVMLLLGVRAVVRRGVTIMSTGERLSDTHLSQLPFNIQESKLVYHGFSSDSKDPNPLDVISEAMRDGLRELKSHPRYLDLPVYDAVRCAPPERPASVPAAGQPGPEAHQTGSDSVVVLCPFNPAYQPHWTQVWDRIHLKYPNKRIVRIRDVASPRLVGQTLYEQIRWAETCIVDWTYWRPNVFFELGVRLACSEIGPVCLLDEQDPEDPASGNPAESPQLTQKGSLKELFRPTEYRLAQTAPERVAAGRALDDAIKAHDEIRNKQPRPVPPSALAHDATYKLIVKEFDWSQERMNFRPDELLRFSIESDVGKDPEKGGTPRVLFSSNFSFQQQLQNSVQERWIAAWYYLLHRRERELTNHDLRKELSALGETALQAIPKGTGDEFLEKLREQIKEYID